MGEGEGRLDNKQDLERICGQKADSPLVMKGIWVVEDMELTLPSSLCTCALRKTYLVMLGQLGLEPHASR